jgi:hypothetical protein
MQKEKSDMQPMEKGRNQKEYNLQRNETKSKKTDFETQFN